MSSLIFSQFTCSFTQLKNRGELGEEQEEDSSHLISAKGDVKCYMSGIRAEAIYHCSIMLLLNSWGPSTSVARLYVCLVAKSTRCTDLSRT